MKHKHVLMSVVLLLVMILSAPLNAYAGVIGSSGSSSGEGTGKPGSYATPIMWVIETDISSTTVLKDNLFNNGDSFEMPAKSSIAYITYKRTPYSYPNNWVRWKTWYRLGFGDPNSSYNRGLWTDWRDGGTKRLLPQEFRNMAIGGLYKEKFAGALYHNGTEYADAIWVNPATIWFWNDEETTVNTIVYFSNSGDPSKNFDNTSKTAEWHWNNPVGSYNYSYVSKAEQYNYTHSISSRQITVRKFTEWQENALGEKRDVSSIYSVINPISNSTIASWSTEAPSLSYKYFVPHDLRTELPLKASVFKDLGYRSNISDVPLEVKVDNYQEKVDVENPVSIPSIDTNTPRKFKLVFENDQFGIPSLASGGIDIAETKAPFSEEINGVQIYWEPKIRMSATNVVTNPPTASIEFAGTEKLGTDSLVKSRGFRGGDFSFRSIKIGDYLLGSNGKPFWMATYQTGIYFRYGSKYDVTVSATDSGPSFSPVNTNQDVVVQNNHVYVGDISATVEQPILYAPFKVSTVGGYKK